MAVYNIGPQGVSVISPPARETLVKVGKIEAADTDVAFQAFGLPKYAVVIGVYTIATGANTGATVNAGFSASGTELINGASVDATGYATAGTATGTSVGTQLTDDKKVYLKASTTLTNPVMVKVEYYIPTGAAF